ncbi:PREDICTED: uncharacterized protein LOC104820824 isoform X2 [Tarenaya hassleriana]|uniref:uncharacterized protein LOC104820824 isoform X2 n=1 Tax=Tarenaya hassleriana TaxID=28532 RepID=UPI00053C9505|nr:PREDICTED: uncharacterized protein LOC104820824 isoform X2 [Tarenaya hassleriana]
MVENNSSDPVDRHESEKGLASRELKDDVNTKFVQHPDAMALYSQARSQEEEIQNLHEQIAAACLKDMQLLNEKYALERKCADLRMAIDEKQNEAVTSALNELARRKGDLEENLKLAHDLKAAEDERYVFMTSMLGLLAEYGVWPRVANATAISNSIKHLHDQLQWKIKASNDRIRELTSLAEIHPETEFLGNRDSGISKGQVLYGSTGHVGISVNDRRVSEQLLTPMDDMMRYSYQNHVEDVANLTFNGQMRQPFAAGGSQEILQHSKRDLGHTFNSVARKDTRRERTGDMEDSMHDPSSGNEDVASHFYEEGPGIEGFQIIGDATPGEKILGCGFPVRGTTLCMFQWVRHLEDGTRQYIEGATNPEYVVTADDVDKLIAVECIPMDDQGRQGDLVRHFANDHSKIRCDTEMQTEIDMFISRGQATFSVQLLMDSSENWEPASLTLKRSNYQITKSNTESLVISEKYSKDLLTGDVTTIW